MKRKVIKQGNNTLTITLPRKWTEQFNVKAGDEIEIEENGQNLSIGTEKDLALKKISLDITKLDKSVLDSLLAVLHKSGYDEIELIFEEPVLMKDVQKRINSMLIGYEVIEQTNNRCLIKNISPGCETNIENIVRRIFLVTLSLARSSLESIKTGEIKDINELMILEETNNKLTNFCHRVINKKPSQGPKTIYLYTVIWVLESIADDYKDICKLIADKKIRLNKETVSVYGQIIGLFEQFYHLFYNFNLEEMKKLRQEHKHVVKELHKIIKSKNQNPLIIYHLFSITQRIYDCFGSTTGIYV